MKAIRTEQGQRDSPEDTPRRVINPADLPSRVTISELHAGEQPVALWTRHGPIANDLPEMPGECSEELKTSTKKVHNLVTTEGKHAMHWSARVSAASGGW